ncbi:MAG: hypothetical protein K6C36_08400 [Clostridia bacterium]|nr:hypothetical protein [Clostridia bacterium]
MNERMPTTASPENFRTSVRGFNKDDVLGYIDGLLTQLADKDAQIAAAFSQSNAKDAELAAMKEKVAEQSAASAELQASFDARTAEIDELKRSVFDFQSALEKAEERARTADGYVQKNLELAQKNSELLKAVEALQQGEGVRVNDADSVVIDLTARMNKLELELEERGRTVEALTSDVDSLKSQLAVKDDKIADLEAKLAGAQAKLGSAMLDAKLFSEELVGKARAKTDAVFSDASVKAAGAAGRAEMLGSKLSEISKQNSEIFAEMLSLVNDLGESLREFSADAADGAEAARALEDTKQALGAAVEED